MSRWLFRFTARKLFWSTEPKHWKTTRLNCALVFLKLSSQGIRFPSVTMSFILLFPCFSSFCPCVCVCSSLRTRKRTSGDCRSVVDWVGFVRQWLHVGSLSLPDSKIVSLCVEQTAGEMKRLTVAGSRWEEERGSSEEKKKRGEARRGRGSGNDLSFSTHENQMFSRSPRRPIFVTHQRPEDPGILNDSRRIPRSSPELLNQQDPSLFLSAQMIR